MPLALSHSPDKRSVTPFASPWIKTVKACFACRPSNVSKRSVRSLKSRPPVISTHLPLLVRSLPDLPEPLRRHPQILAVPTAEPLNTPGQVVRPTEDDDGNRPFFHYRLHLGIVPRFKFLRIELPRRRWAKSALPFAWRRRLRAATRLRVHRRSATGPLPPSPAGGVCVRPALSQVAIG